MSARGEGVWWNRSNEHEEEENRENGDRTFYIWLLPLNVHFLLGLKTVERIRKTAGMLDLIDATMNYSGVLSKKGREKRQKFGRQQGSPKVEINLTNDLSGLQLWLILRLMLRDIICPCERILAWAEDEVALKTISQITDINTRPS